MSRPFKYSVCVMFPNPFPSWRTERKEARDPICPLIPQQVWKIHELFLLPINTQPSVFLEDLKKTAFTPNTFRIPFKSGNLFCPSYCGTTTLLAFNFKIAASVKKRLPPWSLFVLCVISEQQLSHHILRSGPFSIPVCKKYDNLFPHYFIPAV